MAGSKEGAHFGITLDRTTPLSLHVQNNARRLLSPGQMGGHHRATQFVEGQVFDTLLNLFRNIVGCEATNPREKLARDAWLIHVCHYGALPLLISAGRND